MKKCPKCGKISDRNFCTDCGYDLRDVAGSVCPSCGTESNTKFCPNCGTQIIEKSENEIQGKPVSTGASGLVDSFGELKKYKALLDEGILTQEEFDKEKQSILNAAGTPAGEPEKTELVAQADSKEPQPAAEISKEPASKGSNKKAAVIAILFVVAAVIAVLYFALGNAAPENYDGAVSKLASYIEKNGVEQSDGSYQITVESEKYTPVHYFHFTASDGTVTVTYSEDDDDISEELQLTFAPGSEFSHPYAMKMHVEMIDWDYNSTVSGDEIAYGSIASDVYSGEEPLTIDETSPGLSENYNVVSPETMVEQGGNRLVNYSLNALSKFLYDNELGFSLDMLGFPAYSQTSDGL